VTTPTRLDRLGSLIHKEVAEIIDNRLTDPNIGSVTVTRIKVSKDIKYADVYVSVEGKDESVARSLSALQRSSGYIQKLLAARIIIKQIPVLRFHFDKGYSSALRVYELLRELGETDNRSEG
jgi:ribosome-binding factor A